MDTLNFPSQLLIYIVPNLFLNLIDNNEPFFSYQTHNHYLLSPETKFCLHSGAQGFFLP